MASRKKLKEEKPVEETTESKNQEEQPAKTIWEGPGNKIFGLSIIHPGEEIPEVYRK